MNKTLIRTAIFLFAAACGLAAQAASTVCVENENRGYATILVQPPDQDVPNNQVAGLGVVATGANLSYQWFQKNAAGVTTAIDPTSGGNTDTIVIVNPTSGEFWCEIESTDGLKMPALTRTRNARVNVGTNSDDERRGFADIFCQPADLEVGQGAAATFEVYASAKRGATLTYTWFRVGTAAPLSGADFNGVNTSKLTVMNVNEQRVGSYWCEIKSSLGNREILTRTRDAHVHIRRPVAPPATGEVQTYAPQVAAAPAIKSGSSSCGTHCSWVNYQLGGAGFDPDAGTTKCLARVSIGTNPDLGNTTFNLKWFDNFGGSGCAALCTTNTTMKEFNVNSNKLYFFTVYLTTASPCPPAGSTVTFNVKFE
jgi:hypothetical protein